MYECDGCIYKDGGSCSILTVPSRQVHCRFYRTKKQEICEKTKANQRIRSLPLDHQRHIAAKYYNKRMPWFEKLEHAL